MSLAFGFAVEAYGSSLLHKPIVRFCEQDLPDLYDARLAEMSFHHLLSQCSGLKWRELGVAWAQGNPLWDMEHSPNWISYVMSHEFSTSPGRHFNYSSGASHLLPFLLSKILNTDSSALIKARLFEPLGIEHFRWETDPQGNLAGGKGLWLEPMGLLHLGQLVLQEGQWQGQQVVQKSWLEACTAKHTRGTAFYGDYGYQWWLRPGGVVAALGFGGQAIFIEPRRSLVAVFLGNLGKQDFSLPMQLFETLRLGIDEMDSLV